MGGNYHEHGDGVCPERSGDAQRQLGDIYGSLIGATVIDTGNANLHYDRHLSTQFFTVGNAMMSAFSWKKY